MASRQVCDDKNESVLKRRRPHPDIRVARLHAQKQVMSRSEQRSIVANPAGDPNQVKTCKGIINGWVVELVPPEMTR
jgi:hypothetical protein